MPFKMRTTKPEAGNKYYITKANGGYSGAIKGKPTDPDCDVLSNCVGYAYGRFNEIGDYGYCKYLHPVNAENFIQYAGGLQVGKEPKEGACMVWRKGPTLSNSDGAGHVAIVEKVVNSNQIITSESGWNSKPFWNSTRYRGNGNWGQNYQYQFLGFIYNPATGGTPSKPNPNNNARPKAEKKCLYVGCKGKDVSDLQDRLISLGYNIGSSGSDGIFGLNTKIAVMKFQRSNALSPDGVVGEATYEKLGELHVDGRRVKITATFLNIRKSPGTDSQIVGGLAMGQICEIEGEEDGCGAKKWLRLKNGRGYISADYTEEIND